MRRHFHFNAFIIMVGCLSLLACSQKKAAKKTATDTTTYTSGNLYPSTPYSPYPSTEQITITCSAAAGDIISVALNQTYTWTFSAMTSTGQVATIQSLVASPTPQGMTISGNTITFSPRAQTDLNGTISVTAVSGTSSVSQSKVFTWQSGSGSGLLGGGGFGGILTALLPTLLGALTGGGLGGGGTGGLGGLGGLLGM